MPSRLADSQDFVRLEREILPGVGLAESDGGTGVGGGILSVDRLNQGVLELTIGNCIRKKVLLRIHKFQFVALAETAETPRRVGLRTDSEAVDSLGCFQRAVRRDGHFETIRVQDSDQARVNLLQ